MLSRVPRIRYRHCGCDACNACCVCSHSCMHSYLYPTSPIRQCPLCETLLSGIKVEQSRAGLRGPPRHWSARRSRASGTVPLLVVPKASDLLSRQMPDSIAHLAVIMTTLLCRIGDIGNRQAPLSSRCRSLWTRVRSGPPSVFTVVLVIIVLVPIVIGIIVFVIVIEIDLMFVIVLVQVSHWDRKCE